MEINGADRSEYGRGSQWKSVEVNLGVRGSQ